MTLYVVIVGVLIALIDRQNIHGDMEILYTVAALAWPITIILLPFILLVCVSYNVTTHVYRKVNHMYRMHTKRCRTRQICTDDELKRKFFDLHVEIVDKIISFCKDNNVMIDEIHFNADGVRDSIPSGKWTSCTDSAFRLDVDIEHECGKSISAMSKREYEHAKINHKPFLESY